MAFFELNWGSRDEPTHRNGGPIARTTQVIADRYDVVSNSETYYRIDFFVGDEVVLSLFEIPDEIRRNDNPGLSQ